MFFPSPGVLSSTPFFVKFFWATPISDFGFPISDFWLEPRTAYRLPPTAHRLPPTEKPLNHLKTLPERTIVINKNGIDTRYPRPTFDARHNARIWPHLRRSLCPTSKPAADDALMHKILS